MELRFLNVCLVVYLSVIFESIRVSLRGKKIGSSYASSQRTSALNIALDVSRNSQCLEQKKKRKRKKERNLHDDFRLIMKCVESCSVTFYYTAITACFMKRARKRLQCHEISVAKIK